MLYRGFKSMFPAPHSFLIALAIWSLVAMVPSRVAGGTKSEDGLVYGEAGGQRLTMDYYPPPGKGPHPVVIIIHGGGFVKGDSKNISEAYCADFLVPAGYAVFSINYRLSPMFPLVAMVDDVERAVRFIRHNSAKWDADPTRIALLGGSAGGYLSNMAGLVGGVGNKDAADPVARESAAVQGVVTLYGMSDFQVLDQRPNWQQLFQPVSGEKGLRVALSELSPINHVTSDAPPFLLIHGDKDPIVPFDQSIRFQTALEKVSARCDLIVIHNGEHSTNEWHRIAGVPDWEKELVQWLNEIFRHKGVIGEGIRARIPGPSSRTLDSNGLRSDANGK
jgi:acetyl esterase/lipase